ncbi:MAG: 3-deoxy-D-manno-octulosonic acid transferase [Paludibacteraceae bacterium]|nr:3-deoxy-D-manno-octulosonic acid transferase [Paludibacteraceae bacterium]
MRIYFWLIRLAALCGNKKAQLLVRGEKDSRLAISGTRLGKDSEHWVWFHAASVGEFEQARPIIEKLKSTNSRFKILLTFFSPSGYELRKNYDKADKVMYLPFATRKNARAFLDWAQPEIAILVKYEFWPAYLRELARRAIPTYSISAIFRSGQLFFRPWGRGYLNLLRTFTRIYVQDEASKELLNAHGIDEVEVAGDTRFDRVSAVAAQAKDIPTVARFTEGAPKVIVAGSTWPKDEELFARYMEEHEDVKLVLVPHEIDEEHLHRIFLMFQGKLIRYTDATNGNIRTCRVLVIDTMGMLSSIYRYAHATYVGGGFGVGIHNTLEPAVYGVPVVFGPNCYKFREAKGLIAAGAGKSIRNYGEFAAAMDEALEHHAEIGARAAAYVASEKGATAKISREIFSV